MHTALEAAAEPIRILRRQADAGVVDTPAVPLKTQCSTCHLKDLCLPCGLAGSDVQRLDGLMFGRRKVKPGQPLYREGEKFQFIYAVRTGTFKSSLALKDGREQVTGFHMAGELMGLDGVAQGTHASTATALEDAEICAIPYAHLNELAAGNSNMQHIVSRLMSREIVREHSLMMLLGSMNAEERLAAFLLNLSQRMKARGYSASEFHLRMSRAEIGSYLGMKLETVSRTFSAFAHQRLLEVDKKHVRITNLEGLQQAVSRLMSREIVREHSLMMLLGSMNAEERLAAFLLNLSQRFKLRGYSAGDFHLRMSRAEIGSYLGMKLETVSRTFSAFQQQGILEVDKRHIRIVDHAALQRVFDTRVH